MLIMPILVHNSYFDIRDFKVQVFWYAFAIYSVSIVYTLIRDFIAEIRNSGLPAFFSRFKATFTKIDISVICFAVVVLLSCLTSRYGIHAFTGDLTFKVGGYLLLALCIMFLFVSRCLDQNFKIYYYWVPVVIFLEITAILHCVDIDLIHMYTPDLPYEDRFIFVTTIGNIDYVSEYFCIFLPFYVTLFVKSKKKMSEVLFGIISFFGYLSMLLIRANGMFLGCTLGLLILGVYALNDLNMLKKYILQFYLLAICGWITDLLNSYYIIPHRLMVLDTISSSFIEKKIYFVLAIVTTVIFFILYKQKLTEKLTNVLMIIKKVWLGFIFIGAIGAIIFVAYCLIANKNYAIFDNRIVIWRGVVESYKHMSIREKLIGVGPSGVSDMLDKYCINQHFIRTTAHNEILEYLIATGLLGLISYISMWVLTIRALLKNKCSEFAFIPALFSYIGISCVIGPSFLNTVTIFTFLAISAANARSSKPMEIESDLNNTNEK